MRPQILGFPMLAIAAFMVGCYSSENVNISDVKTDAIYQFYRVNYNAAEDTSRVYARFRVGGERGTNLELTGKSMVDCNGKPLGESSLFGRCYVRTMPGFAGDYEFLFTDTEGDPRKNTIQLHRSDFMEDTPATLSRGERHSLRFAGPPLVEGETIELKTVTDSTESNRLEREDPLSKKEKLRDGTQTLGRVSETGATSVALNPAVLGEMSNGLVSIKFVRSVRRDLQAATAKGGILEGRYESIPRKITLTE